MQPQRLLSNAQPIEVLVWMADHRRTAPSGCCRALQAAQGWGSHFWAALRNAAVCATRQTACRNRKELASISHSHGCTAVLVHICAHLPKNVDPHYEMTMRRPQNKQSCI